MINTNNAQILEHKAQTSATLIAKIKIDMQRVRYGFAAAAVIASVLGASFPSVTAAQGGGREGGRGGMGRPMPQQGMTFDFTDADIRSVLSSIAKAGGINIVYGDIPARTVSLHVKNVVGREAFLTLLKSIANSNSLRVNEDGDVVMISQNPIPMAMNPNMMNPLANTEVYIYRLKHANAARMASVLQSTFSGAVVAGGQTGFSRQTLSAQNQGGGFGGGFGGQGGQFGGQGGRNTFGANTGNLQQRVGQGGFGGGGAVQGIMGGQVIIVPEEATNTLIVRAEPADWEIVKRSIEAVDLRPLQVLIEVMIAEVRRSDDLNVGVGINANNDRSFDRTRGRGRLLTDTSSNFVVDFTRFGSIDVNVALAALKARGDVRILSMPLIFAQNNQESRLLVGAQRPFIQTSRTLATENAARDQVVQYRDVGTSLAILPTINPDGYVNLQVQQEVSSVTNEVQFGAPVISTREALASLFVKDGQTVVVGGLTDNQEEKIRSGIPGLSSLPGIGFLFGSTQRTNIRTELFLFLTPHVVQVDEDVERIRKEIKEKSPLLQDVKIEPIITTPMDSTAPKRPTIEEPTQKDRQQPSQQVPMEHPFPPRRPQNPPQQPEPAPEEPQAPPPPPAEVQRAPQTAPEQAPQPVQQPAKSEQLVPTDRPVTTPIAG